MSNNTGTTAPEASYPAIVPAPRSSNVRWVDEPGKAPAGAVDQTYPKIVPAPRADAHPRCPHCGEPL